jgi:hypothetical protein
VYCPPFLLCVCVCVDVVSARRPRIPREAFSSQPSVGLIGTGQPSNANGQFERPFGVAFHKNSHTIAVTDKYNNRIQFFSQDCKFISSFGSQGTNNSQFNYPYGICCPNDGSNNLIVSDNHRVQVFHVDSSSSLQHLFSIGSSQSGNANNQFYYPYGVYCTVGGIIMVADTFNHRIQMFDVKGKFIRSVGSQGSNNNQFQYPYDVCVHNNTQQMMVADCSNHRLSVWSADGSQHIHTLPLAGGEFPAGICIDPHTQHIVVSCDGSHDVRVLDVKVENGQLVQQIGQRGSQPGQFSWPTGVCIDDRGVLIVADFSNHRVQLF